MESMPAVTANRWLTAVVEPFDRRVNLDPVAGREDHALLDVLALQQQGERLGTPLRVDREPFQKVERRTAVVEAGDEDGHTVSLVPASPPASAGADRDRCGRWRQRSGGQGSPQLCAARGTRGSATPSTGRPCAGRLRRAPGGGRGRS